MRRPLAHLIASCLALSLLAPTAGRAEDDLDGWRPMSPEDAAATRGGLRTAWGLEFGFGALASTFIDGELILQSRLTLTDAGAMVEVEAGVPTPDLAALARAYGLQLTPDLSQPGVLVPGEGGATVAFQAFAPDRIAQVALNTADGRDVRQTLEMTLYLPDLARLQQEAVDQRLRLGVESALGAALLASAQP